MHKKRKLEVGGQVLYVTLQCRHSQMSLSMLCYGLQPNNLLI